MNEKEIQQDIQNKQKQLDDLKAKILVEQETVEKAKLQDDQKKLEEDIASKTGELAKLKGTIDPIAENNDDAYQLMLGTEMEEKLKAAGKSDAEIKAFAEKIDSTVRTYLKAELVWFSNKIKNPLCTWIQFAMMDTLSQEIASGWDATEFFNLFGGTDVTSGTGAFKWFLDAFSSWMTKVNRVNGFFTLARRVENLKQYLVMNTATITSYANIPELMNATKVITLLKNPIWDNIDPLYAKDIKSLGVFSLNDSSNPVGVEMSEEDKKALKSIADKAYGNLSPEETKKLMEKIDISCDTATKFLKNRSDYSDKITTLYESIYAVNNKELPFGLWKVWDLLGFDIDTIFGEKTPIIDFVLSILGISGGLKGLHKKYVREKYKELMAGDAFTKEAYGLYQAGLSSTATNDDADSTWKHFESTFSALEDEQKTSLKALLPPQYALLKSSLVSSLQKNPANLNPTVIQQFAPEAIVITKNPKTKKDESEVDASKIINKEGFVDQYLTTIIPTLVGSPKFMSSKTLSSSTFALTIFGTMVAGNYFMDGITSWVIALTEFVSPITTTPTSTTWTWETISYTPTEETDPELVKLAANAANDKSKNYAEDTTYVQYLYTLEAKHDLPYGISLNLMKKESTGKLYRSTWEIIWSTAGARGLFQFLPGTAKDYIKKMGRSEWEYELIFTNPIIAAQACVLYLQDCMRAWDNTITALAHYNAWPWKLNWAAIDATNFKKLPLETQKYVVTIWYDMLENMKLPTILSKNANNDVVVDETKLPAFFDAVNKIPKTKDMGKVEQQTDNKIIAKTLDQLTGFWDSSMWWLALWWLKNTKNVDSKSAAELYDWLMDPTHSIEKDRLKKWASCVLTLWYNDISKDTLSTTGANIEKIIVEMKPAQVILCTMVYAQNKKAIPDPKIDELNKIIRDVATKTNSPLIDLNKKSKAISLNYGTDGEHLTTSSYKELTKIIEETVQPTA
jgi:hypothetical protein